MVHITNYKHKYNKYKQKYLNLLYGGAGEIHIRHIKQSTESTQSTELPELPFLVADDFIDGAIMGTQFVSLLDEQYKQQLQQVIGKVRDKNALTSELSQVHEAGMSEQTKKKENINNVLLKELIKRRNALVAEIASINKNNNSVNKEIFDLLIIFFITQFYIVINGKNYRIVSFITVSGQGMVFRICTVGMEGTEGTEGIEDIEGMEGIHDRSNYIIKFAYPENCDEIEHEATTLNKYYTANGDPVTFTPYKSLSYGKTGSICFSVYDDVGNEDLYVFVNAIKRLISMGVESMGVESGDRGELHDRIMMIPHILIQILLQLEYYKKYRHNDIRLENIVIDIHRTTPMTPSLPAPIYQGAVISLLRVTIIDFGKFNPPERIGYSQLYITSPETLERWFDVKINYSGVAEDKVYDNQNSDLVGFMWTVIDLLIGERGETLVIDELMRIVLLNEKNLPIDEKEREKYKKLGKLSEISENWKKKLLLFIYQSLMYNFDKEKYTVRFKSMVIDPLLTFEKVGNILLDIHNDFNNRIIELLFSNDRKMYNYFIRNLLLLLQPCTERPSIESCLTLCRTTFKIE